MRTEYRIVYQLPNTGTWVSHTNRLYPYGVRIYTTPTELKNGLTQVRLRYPECRVERRTVSEWSS